MPFKETCPMEERVGLFRDYETGVFSVSDLCRRYGISRETFYVLKRRRECGDDIWFAPRRARLRVAMETAGDNRTDQE